MLTQIDWRQVVLNLRRSGLTDAQIAWRIGYSERGVNKLAAGQVQYPRWPGAIALLDLHCDRCPERHQLEHIT